MHLNTIVKLPNGEVGTICYNHLDGTGGVYGRHTFEMPEGGFGDNLPAPEFMLRSPFNMGIDVEFFEEWEVLGETPE